MELLPIIVSYCCDIRRGRDMYFEACNCSREETREVLGSF